MVHRQEGKTIAVTGYDNSIVIIGFMYFLCPLPLLCSLAVPSHRTLDISSPYPLCFIAIFSTRPEALVGHGQCLFPLPWNPQCLHGCKNEGSMHIIEELKQGKMILSGCHQHDEGYKSKNHVYWKHKRESCSTSWARVQVRKREENISLSLLFFFFLPSIRTPLTVFVEFPIMVCNYVKSWKKLLPTPGVQSTRYQLALFP